MNNIFNSVNAYRKNFLPELLEKLSRNIQRKGLFRSSLFILILNMCSVVFGFALEALLARLMSTEHYGIYRYVISWTAVIGLLATLGGNVLLLRVFPGKFASGFFAEARGVLEYARSLCLRGSLVLTSVVLLALLFFGQGLHWSFLAAAFVAAACIPLVSFSWLQEARLQSLQLATWSRVSNGLLRPIFRTLLVGSLYLISPLLVDEAWEATWMQFVTFLASLLLMEFFLTKRTPAVLLSAYSRQPPEASFRLSITLLSISLFILILEEISTIILGFYLGMEEVAMYNTGYRVAVVAGFGLQAVGTLAAPIFSEYHATRTKEECQTVVSHFALIASLFALPIILALLFFGQHVLAIFGEQYVAAYPVLFILCLGQIVNVSTGSCGYLMLMSGREDVQFRITLGALILSAGILPFIVQAFGKEGAAFVAACILSGRNLLTWWIARQELGIDSSVWRALGELFKRACR